MKRIILIVLTLAMYITCSSMHNAGSSGMTGLSASIRNSLTEATTDAETPEDIHLQPPVLSEIRNVPDGVEISWQQSPGAEKYRVLRRLDDEAWENLGDTDGLNFIDVMADPGLEYTYTVRCVNGEGTAYTSFFDEAGLRILVT